VCSTKKVEDAYGAGKEQIIAEAEQRVRDAVKPYGINIEKIYPLGAFVLPTEVVTRLNEKIERIQQAEAKEYQVREAIAEANVQREKARGEADAKLISAEGEARALDIIGKALDANPSLIQYESVKKWDGVLPQVSGSGGMIMQLPQLNK
jgi:regulator of protease activity HflC (stomatin/prohibitin superfamily)